MHTATHAAHTLTTCIVVFECITHVYIIGVESSAYQYFYLRKSPTGVIFIDAWRSTLQLVQRDANKWCANGHSYKIKGPF
eukprot:m.993034 g.993034  ORF g.993034 m.993034 type:complete len:80 (-) comp24009_c0_seq4:34-273(-)